MQVPNSFDAMQLFPTLLQLAEKRRAEQEAMTGWRGAIRNFSELPQEQIAALEGLGPTHGPAILNNMLTQNAANKKQQQADADLKIQKGILGGVADIGQMENAYPEVKAAEQDFGWSDAATEGQPPLAETTPSMSRIDKMRQMIDTGLQGYKQDRQELLTRGMSYLDKFMTDEQKGKLLLGGSGAGVNKPKELYTPEMYQGQPVGIWDYTKVEQGGMPKFIPYEGAGKPSTKEELFEKYFKSGDYLKAMSLADDPISRRMVVRQAGNMMRDNKELQSKNQPLWQEFQNMELEDKRKEVYHFSSTVTNEKGTTVFEEKEYDPKTGVIRVIDRKEGRAETVPTGVVAQAWEKLPIIDEALKKLDTVIKTITPNNQSKVGLMKRWGESLAGKLLNPNYNPSKDAEGRAIVDFNRDQVGLMIARVESGTARPEAEIERISQAYLSGDMSYWEAKIQMKLLKEDLKTRQSAYLKAMNREKYIPYTPEADITGAVRDPKTGKLVPK